MGDTHADISGRVETSRRTTRVLGATGHCAAVRYRSGVAIGCGGRVMWHQGCEAQQNGQSGRRWTRFGQTAAGEGRAVQQVGRSKPLGGWLLAGYRLASRRQDTQPKRLVGGSKSEAKMELRCQAWIGCQTTATE